MMGEEQDLHVDTHERRRRLRTVPDTCVGRSMTVEYVRAGEKDSVVMEGEAPLADTLPTLCPDLKSEMHYCISFGETPSFRVFFLLFVCYMVLCIMKNVLVDR